MKRNVKERIIYSNYYDWISDEDLKQEMVDSELVDSIDDITQEEMYKERYFLEEMYWDDIRREIDRFDKANKYIIFGTQAR